MRYVIVDSHRRMTTKKKDEMLDFFCNAEKISRKVAYKRTDFCEWFEKEYAVKWFEMFAYDKGKMVGYLKCLRHPDIGTEWFVGDIHVLEEYRGRGIASAMYERTIEEVYEYQAAEKIVASVHPDNQKSIGLHEKMGFVDTKQACTFPHLKFEPEEKAHVLWLYQYLPVVNKELAMEGLLPLWQEYFQKEFGYSKQKAKRHLEDILKKACEEDKYTFESIWCGNSLVGFVYYNDEEEVMYNIRELHQKGECEE